MTELFYQVSWVDGATAFWASFMVLFVLVFFIFFDPDVSEVVSARVKSFVDAFIISGLSAFVLSIGGQFLAGPMLSGTPLGSSEKVLVQVSDVEIGEVRKAYDDSHYVKVVGDGRALRVVGSFNGFETTGKKFCLDNSCVVGVGDFTNEEAVRVLWELKAPDTVAGAKFEKLPLSSR